MNCIRFGLLLLLAIPACQQQRRETPTRGQTIAVVTESLAPLIQKEAEEFHRLYPEATITVSPASSREAIVLMLNDSIRLIITDRQLNAEELDVAQRYKITYVETKIAEDALAVLVHQRNPSENISLQSLEKIISGSVSSWSRVPESDWTGKIELVLTGRNSGVYELLMNHFFHLKDLIRPHAVPESQSGVLEYITARPHAIGIVSTATIHDTAGLPALQTLRASTRVLAVGTPDSVKPHKFVKLHQANVYRHLYPLHYPVYLYMTAHSTSVAAGFSAFITSATGQKIFLNAGLVPVTMPVRLVQITQEPLSQ